MTDNGYAKMHTVPIQVRADMLESVDGMSSDVFAAEIAFAVPAIDLADPATMRWAITLFARQITELESADNERA